MTNEEKAKSLVGCPADVSINEWNGEEYNKLGFEYAMEMAKWKDQQFKEYLEKKVQEINPDIWENGNINRVLSACKKGTIIKIINELFKKD